MEEIEIVRIPSRRYEQMRDIARRIARATDDPDEHRNSLKFWDKEIFPTVEDMESHHVAENLRKYLPFLIFHVEIRQHGYDYEMARQYILDIFHEYLDVIDDDAMDPILAITPAAWKKMSITEKVDAFDELVSYYGREEFESFLKDLEYCPFMGAFLTRKKYEERDAEAMLPLKKELQAIWLICQNR